MNEQGERQSGVVAEGGLRQLVAAERRLALALAVVEQEASALVHSAQEDATRESAELDERIAADVAALVTRIASELDTELARLAVATERYCRTLDALTEDAVDELAAEVESQLLSPELAESVP